MKTRKGRTAAIACLGLATVVSMVWAADRSDSTTIDVKMHCGGCAKKVAAKLYEVPGVAEVRADPEADIVVVIPKPELPSPHAQATSPFSV